jgi:hypothetical protein
MCNQFTLALIIIVLFLYFTESSVLYADPCPGSTAEIDYNVGQSMFLKPIMQRIHYGETLPCLH